MQLIIANILQKEDTNTLFTTISQETKCIENN